MNERVEGFGRTVTGGAGGSPITVTNLNDSGAGSLRAALSGVLSNRIVSFDPSLSGIITLTGSDNFKVQGVNVTIDGFSNQNVEIQGRGIRLEGSNIIVQGLRMRVTDGAGVDNLTLIGGSHDILVRNNSFANGSDECVSGAGGIAGINGTHISNVTIQYNIIGPGRPPTGDNALLALWSVARRVSWHHNIFYSADDRCPRLAPDTGTPDDVEYDFCMNIISHWGDYGVDTNLIGLHLRTEALRANIIQNLFVTPGAAGSWDNGMFVAAAIPSKTCLDSYGRGLLRGDGGTSFSSILSRTTPWPVAERVNIYDIRREYNKIIANAGAPFRDSIDIATILRISSVMTLDLARRPVFCAGAGVGGSFGPAGDPCGPIQVIG